MTGRQTFARYSWIIKLTVKVLKFVPIFVRQFIWDGIKPYSQLPFIGLRYVLLHTFCKQCGSNVRIGTNVTLINIQNINFGSNISIHDNCYIDGAGGLEIHSNVSVAHNSSILTTNHTWDAIEVPIKYNPIVPDKVVIQEDVWIGCGCRILSGVTIGRRAIIAAGAVVNKDIKNNSIYGGVPAKFIKSI